MSHLVLTRRFLNNLPLINASNTLMILNHCDKNSLTLTEIPNRIHNSKSSEQADLKTETFLNVIINVCFIHIIR